jgi:ribosomal protein S18 acetylase RimI-like enzyme
MTSPQQLEILDLRHFTGRQLRALLEQEAEVWNARLRWDYRSSTELLLQYLDSRILPGFVALDRGRICGFCFCVYEGHKAVIGDIYASRSELSPHAIIHSLTRHLLETLEASPDIARIEAQLLLFDDGILPPIFASSVTPGTELRTFRRLFLERDLLAPAEAAPTPTFPTGIELCRWSPTFYNPTAELIQHAYVGHLDANINDQYRTVAGSQRFLHNIIRFPGCGTFDPDSSFVLRERRSNTLIAVILCSRVAPDAAHITQLCVAPNYRGRRLGETLLRLTLRHLPTRSYRFITLTVSENNLSALRLYSATGFRTRHRFDALVLDKLTKPSRVLSFLTR